MKVLVSEAHLEDIADAIREKLGGNDTYRPGDMAGAIESIETGYPEPTGTLPITANGTVNVKDYASANVNVPNSYAAEDEGKVVSSGALVAQTSQTVTQNGTYDTTLINELIANISGGGGSSNILSGATEPLTSQGNNGDIYLRYADIPAGYTGLDFIASSGTQYIDTGIIGETDVEVQMDFSFIESIGQWRVMFGSFTNNNENSFTVFVNGLSTISYQRGYLVYQDVSYALALDTLYSFRTSKNKLYVNETETHSLSNYVVTTPSTITLSAVHKGNAIDMYAPAHRIYGAKIWKDDVLVRWFVPCERNSDNVPGLYDVIGNQFYVSGSSTDYAAGNTVTFDDELVLDVYLKVNGAWQALVGSDIDDVDTSGSINLQSKTITENGTVTPDAGYDGLSSVVVNVQGSGGEDPFLLTDYIESNGTQYINTEYAVTTGTRIEIVANVSDNSTLYPALFGARNSTNNEVVIFVEFGGNNIAMVWANGDTEFAPVFWGRGYIGQKCEYILGQNGVTGIRDKDNYGFKGTRTTGTGTSLPLYIFALNENGSPNSVTFCAAKLYRMRIYENDTLVHEYVPWTDSNNVVCLKDTVTSNLLYNAGTGNFVRGSDT